MLGLLYSIILLIFICSASFGNTVCNLKVATGIDSDVFRISMIHVCDFLKKAEKKRREIYPDSPVLSVLSGGPLSQLKNEGYEVVMVVGRSADFATDGSEDQRKRDAELEILSALKRFDPARTVFISGGTASGDIGLFHELSVKKGFRVVGVSALDAAKYQPALMTDFYVEFGKGFGTESETAIRSSTALLMLGGGNQAAREAIRADLYKIPVYVVNNPLFNEKKMKSAEVTHALSESNSARSFHSAAEAADAMTLNQAKSVIPSLPAGSIDLNPEDLKSIYKDKFFLGFSTWATTEVPKESEEKFRAAVEAILRNLDPSKMVILTAGTIYGGEGIVAELAAKIGFEVIGAPVSENIKPEMFSKNVKKFVLTGRTWETRNSFFTSLLDGLVVSGKSITLTEHLMSSKNAGKPTFNLKGFNSVMDGFSNNLKTGINFSIDEIERVISEMEKYKGVTLRSSKISIMCSEFYRK